MRSFLHGLVSAVYGLGLVAVLVCPPLLAQNATSRPFPGATRHSFEDNTAGGKPVGFQVAETAGAGNPAGWRVEAAADAPDGKQVLAVQSDNHGETYNLLMSADEHPADLATAVWLRARTGTEDQGGGLVWRARDANNYYIARWNPLEDNVRLYKVEDGKRTMFVSAEVQADAASWHRLSVTMRGQEMTVALDGKEMLRKEDGTFSGAGKVGLWTKADASTQFDLLEVQPAPVLFVSTLVTEPPVVDGVVEDAAWRAAAELTVRARRVLPPDVGTETEVKLRCVHTVEQIFFQVRWRDATKDDFAHKPWTWNASKSAYEEGPEREDMFALAFANTGEFDANMLSGKEAVWDVWQWKAVRTNPQAFAMDRTHRYSRAQPTGKAKEHRAANGASIWIARPEDAGDTVEKKQPAPAAHAGDVVPQYLLGTPAGSAADVKAKGVWQDGWWTLEFGRRLDTGHVDDTAFARGKRVLMALSAHDRTGDMDKASATIELAIEDARR